MNNLKKRLYFAIQIALIRKTTLRQPPFFYLLWFCIGAVYGQEISLSGQIVDTDNLGFSYANVLLLSPKDSTLVSGTITDEQGVFILKNLEAGNYLLKNSFIGFKDEYRSISLKHNLELKTITLIKTVEALNEVTISAKKPRIKREIDRLVFTVENSNLSTGNTFDLLRKTPGVILNGDKIIIKNSSATVYLNNKKVYLSASELRALLESFDATNIKAVEIITSPPASFDAEGGSVLNIITSKNVSIGYKGNLNGQYQQASLPKYRIGANHFYKNKTVNLFASYSFSPRTEIKKDRNTIQFFSPQGDKAALWESDFKRRTKKYSHNANAILDINLDDKNTLSASTNLLFIPKEDYQNTDRTSISTNTQLDSRFITQSTVNKDRHNLSFGLSHDLVLDDRGSKLTSGIDYIDYDDEQLQKVNSKYFLPDNSFLNEDSFLSKSYQKTKIFTAKIDLVKNHEKGAFETGLKFSNIDNESALNFFDTDNNTEVLNTNLSDDFKYSEQIYAAYLSWNKDWGKWDFKLGLRAEITEIKATSISLGDVNNQDYFDLFPTTYLQYSPNDKNNFSLSYSRRISRPRFQSLNPFKYFINENSSIDGNPNLRRSLEDKIALSYTYKSKYIFELGYQTINNGLSVLPFQDNLNNTYRSVESNLEQEIQYSLDFIYFDSINSWWYVSMYMSGFYFDVDFIGIESNAKKVSNNTWGYYVQVYNQFTLSKDRTFTGDLTSSYFSNFVFGSYSFKNQFSLNISFRKTIWNKRAEITVGIDDIFDTNNVLSSSKYLNQDNSFFSRPESRIFSIGFRYNFGNFRLSDNNRKGQIDQGERLN